MQTLWSRAAQAQSSCRCRICLHSTNAIVRRSTTAAPKRKVTIADVFTACYTTILGTAAVLDARRKDERRRELDQELDRARASLKNLTVPGSSSSLDRESDAPDGRMLGTMPRPTFISSQTGKESIRHLLDEELKSLCNITLRPFARQSWLQDQIEWINIEAAVVAEEKDPDILLREPKSDEHLARTTASIVALVDQLLARSRRGQGTTEAIEHAEDGILKEVENLRYGHEFPSYQFPSTNPRYSAHVRALLAESIRRIFNQAGTLQETVGRICHNLLIAGVPPTVHTYNTLIAGFNRIGQPDLAQAVVDSYLTDTRWPATDRTVICLLNHYRAAEGRDGLREIAQRMRGATANLHKRTLYKQDFLAWATEDYALRDRGWIQKIDRNDAMFDGLIRGWLYHEEIGRACMAFVACLRSGGSTQVYTLQELFRGCLVTVNSSAARQLLVGIIKHFENFKSLFFGIIQDSSTEIARNLLRSLYQILNICWLPFSEIYGQSYQTYGSATFRLRSIIRQMELQLEIQATAQLPTLLFDILSSGKSLLSRLELAISTLDKAKLRRPTTPVSETAYTRLARLISIEKRYEDLEEMTQNLSVACNTTFIKIKTGFDFDKAHLWVNSYLDRRDWHDRQLTLRRALSQIDARHDSLTRNDIKYQLVHRIPDQRLVRQLEGNDYWARLDIQTIIWLFGHYPVPSISHRGDEFDDSYEQLEWEVQKAEDSTRALLFTYLNRYMKKRALYHYGGYYQIPFEKLVDYHVRERYCNGKRQRSQFVATHGTAGPSHLGLEAAAGSESADGWGEVYQYNEPQPLPTLCDESLPLQHAALG
ncbi:hypothetical protein F5Y19DRAFT_212914 [Xylariaceae sp. FL1651]|nr:hypothetical protein F5Y19DRAFT_212914 [Xylariaceae sp. FL1651]